MAVAKKYGSVAKARSSIKSSAGGAGFIHRVQAGEPKMVRFLTEPDEWVEAYFHWPEGGKPTWCPGGEKKGLPVRGADQLQAGRNGRASSDRKGERRQSRKIDRARQSVVRRLGRVL